MIAAVGNSGSGKSHSISTLNPKETFLISVSGKKLPMRGFDKYYTSFSKTSPKGNKVNSSDAIAISQVLMYVNKNMQHIKNVVIDDRIQNITILYFIKKISIFVS